MNNLQEKHIERIINFCNEIELTHLNIWDYLDAYDFDNLDFSNAFEEILDILDEKNAFDIQIIYYSEAMKYLSLQDTSLVNSLEIANEYGYKLEDINSELLASLLASQITREAFFCCRYEIETFFENFDSQEFDK